MSSQGKLNYASKTQGSGVSWYNHVTHKFMIPYGIKKRDDHFEGKELLSIMKPNTCELLCRPSISISNSEKQRNVSAYYQKSPVAN